jgi:hypothetical protein
MIVISYSCSVALTVSVNRVSDAWVEANLGGESPARARLNEPGRSRSAGYADAQAECGWTSHGPKPGRAVHPGAVPGRDLTGTTGPTGAKPFQPVPSVRPEARLCREARRKTGRPGPNRVKNPYLWRAGQKSVKIGASCPKPSLLSENVQVCECVI